MLKMVTSIGMAKPDSLETRKPPKNANLKLHRPTRLPFIQTYRTSMFVQHLGLGFRMQGLGVEGFRSLGFRCLGFRSLGVSGLEV